ncbi:neprilysin-1-like [Ornithodoros turicata]|uniref:neprilysin-1-like n=1 Tax=Ornithodoros turicata TaxID=34597 RepID=UPI003139E547
MIHMGPSTTRRLVGPSPSAVLGTPAHPPMSPRKRSVGRIALPIVGILLVCVIVLAVYRTISPLVGSMKVETNACTSSSCTYFATIYREALNSSVDPCQNFYQFVCSRWTTSHRDPFMRSIRDTFFGALDRQLSNIFTPREGQTAVQKAARFFQSCRAISRGFDGLQELKKVLRRIGILWPHYSQDPDTLSAMFVLSMDWEWPTLLDFRKNRREENLWYEISCAASFGALVNHRVGALKKGSYVSYFEMLRERFNQNLNQTITYEEMSVLEEKVLKSLYTAYIVDAADEIVWTTLDNLTTLAASNKKWQQALQLDANTSSRGDIKIAIRNYAYFEDVFNLIEQVGEKDMHLFLGWNLVQHVVFYASNDLIDNYLKDTGVNAEETKRRFCVCMTQKYMGVAIYHMYFQELVKAHVVQDITHIIKNVHLYFIHRISQAHWLKANSTLINGLGATEKPLRYLNNAFNSRLDDAYYRYEDMSKNFLQNYQKAIQGLRNSDENYITAMKCDTIERGRTYEMFDVRKDFMLAPYSLTVPFYDFETPSGIKFGGLGMQIAKALAHLLWVTNWQKDSNTSITFTVETDCFLSTMQDHVIGSEGLYRWMPLNALWEAFRSASGVADANLAHLPQYSESMLFFISSCYPECGGNKSEDICNAPLRHSRRFAETFSCPVGSPMNPKAKCSIF